jgi:hypothetical protein
VCSGGPSNEQRLQLDVESGADQHRVRLLPPHSGRSRGVQLPARHSTIHGVPLHIVVVPRPRRDSVPESMHVMPTSALRHEVAHLAVSIV